MVMHSSNNRWNPPLAYGGAGDYTAPPVREKFEIIRSDPTNYGAWKPCQHYKCVTLQRADRRLLPVSGTTSAQVPRYTSEIKWATTEPYRSDAHAMVANGWKLKGIPAEVAWDCAAPAALLGLPGAHLVGAPPLYVTPGEEPNGDFIPDPSNLGELQFASLQAMLPTIKSELSLINSVLELKDFKSLPKTLKGIGEFGLRLAGSLRTGKRLNLKSELGHIRRTFSKKRGPTLREALNVGADSYLSYSFAIAPLLSDVCGMYRALRDTQARINDLVNRQGKRRVKHFTMRLSPTSSEDHVTSAPFSFSGGGQFTGTLVETPHPWMTWTYASRSLTCGGNLVRRIKPADAVFHAQIEYNYYFTRFQTENAQLLGLLDALGVNLDPSIIWNAIPWSFVVDWVSNIGSWLGRRKVMNMEPQINISRYQWSMKTTRRTEVFLEDYETFPGDRHEPLKMHELWESSYKRGLNMIPTSDPLIVGGLSLRELSLAGALAITRKWRPKRGNIKPQ